jgi:hypothetical protein
LIGIGFGRLFGCLPFSGVNSGIAGQTLCGRRSMSKPICRHCGKQPRDSRGLREQTKNAGRCAGVRGGDLDGRDSDVIFDTPGRKLNLWRQMAIEEPKLGCAARTHEFLIRSHFTSLSISGRISGKRAISSSRSFPESPSIAAVISSTLLTQET